MNKFLLTIASAAFAFATFASSAAEAGFKIHFGFGGGFHHHHHHHHWRPRYVVRTPAKPRVYVARKAKPVPVVEEEPVTTVAAVHNENSSITVASADVADSQATDSVEQNIVKTDKTADAAKPADTAATPEKVAEAAVDAGSQAPKKLDCKKFFPTVGLTLTTPCE